MISRTALVLSVLSVFCAVPVSAEPEERPTVAVVPFDIATNLRAEEPELSVSLAIFTGAALSDKYEVLDRAAFEKARAAMKKTLSELQDSLELGVPLGFVLKADMLIYGRVSSFGGRLVLHMKVLYVEQKKWGKTESCVAGSIESLLEAVPLLLTRLGFPKAEAEEKPRRKPARPRVKPPAKPREKPERPPVKAPAKPRITSTWIEQLQSPDAGVRFAAAVELGHTADKKAVEPLIRIVREDLDTFVRRAAARSLGELHAVEAVPALIEVLADKEFFVASTAHSALRVITRHDFGLRDGMTRAELRKLVEAGKAWWAEKKPK